MAAITTGLSIGFAASGQRIPFFTNTTGNPIKLVSVFVSGVEFSSISLQNTTPVAIITPGISVINQIIGTIGSVAIKNNSTGGITLNSTSYQTGGQYAKTTYSADLSNNNYVIPTGSSLYVVILNDNGRILAPYTINGSNVSFGVMYETV